MSHPIVDESKSIIVKNGKNPIDKLATTAVRDIDTRRRFQQIGNWQEPARGRVSEHKSISAHEESIDTRVSLHKPRLIELAFYPGYDEDLSTPLPFDISASDIIDDVVNSQAKLKSKPSFSEYCRANFKDVRGEKILLDLFWWIFLDSFERNKLVQENLFVRIANTFGDFFSLLPRQKNFKDRFLQILPDILSQIMFTAFIRAYSTSWKRFDDAFKSRICNLIHFWFSGLPPFPNSWKNWPIDKLVPGGVLLHNSIDLNIPSTGVKFSLNLDSKHQNQESSHSKVIPKKFIFKKPHKSHHIGPSYDFQRSLFRTSGHSPLMDYYLSSKDIGLPPSSTVLLTHSSVLPYPDTASITYYDFIHRYNKRAQARRNKMYDIMRNTNESILRRRMEQARDYKQQMSSTNKSKKREELKYLRQRLVLHAMSDDLDESQSHPKEGPFLLESQVQNRPEP